MNTILLIKPTNKTALELYSNHSHYHPGDSGLDLYILEDIDISPGETKLVDLGIQCEMLQNTNNLSYYLYPRSSISKTPLIMANHVGIIDAGYRGNIKVALKYIPTQKDLLDLCYNKIFHSKYTIKAGTRLVQICSPNLSPFDFKLTDTLSETSRSTGGFGSTGK